MKKNNKINKIIIIVIDILISLGILLFIGSFIYNLIMDQVVINKTISDKYLTQDDKEVQIMEVISEKVYNAFIEKNKEKVDSFTGILNAKSQEEINAISEQIKIDADKVDAKALEIYKLADNAYKVKVEFKDENDTSYQMNGQKIMFLFKTNKKSETFKVLDMKVGV